MELLKKADALPVYCESDNELCLRAGYTSGGELLVAIFTLGFDPEENVTLYLSDAPQSARLLGKDGSYSAVTFEAIGNDRYVFDVMAEPMYPVILLIDN